MHRLIGWLIGWISKNNECNAKRNTEIYALSIGIGVLNRVS
jgi:hypothetical protein